MYRYFLKKLGGEYKPKHSDNEVLTNFLLELHLRYNLKTLDKRFFFTYLGNQFYWREGSRSFNKYSLLNIFGKAPLKRYLEDTKKSELGFIDDLFLSKNKIRFSELFPESKLKLESKERKRFHNTPAGLNFCLDTTTLYDRNCFECMTCNFQKECREIKSKFRKK